MTLGSLGGSEPVKVRPAAVEGLFYPSDDVELRRSVRSHLERASATDQPESDHTEGLVPAERHPTEAMPKAIIAPHAGLQYSGATAGHAYAALASHRGRVKRAVVVGPAHRVPLEGVGVTSADQWSTPLGQAMIDREAVAALQDLPGVITGDQAHRPEHSIEVQLPFLREALGEVAIVPLVVGRASPAQVARVLNAAWGDDSTVIVASSDLSHYLDDDTARQRDRRTAAAVLEGRVADIGPRDACGCLPIGGLLAAAAPRGLAARLLHLSTSADTAGDPDRVVGYGSFALLPPLPLRPRDGEWLLQLAARSIGTELKGESSPVLGEAEADAVPVPLRRPGAAFVTLTHGANLVGCIGSLEPQRPLWRDVIRNARAAAFDDPRFPGLEAQHLDDLTIEVSVLSPLQELSARSAADVVSLVRPGADGVVLAAQGKRGTFLPDVWEKIPEPDRFVSELGKKAQWEEPWPEGARAWKYMTEVFTAPWSSFAKS